MTLPSITTLPVDVSKSPVVRAMNDLCFELAVTIQSNVKCQTAPSIVNDPGSMFETRSPLTRPPVVPWKTRFAGSTRCFWNVTTIGFDPSVRAALADADATNALDATSSTSAARKLHFFMCPSLLVVELDARRAGEGRTTGETPGFALSAVPAGELGA